MSADLFEAFVGTQNPRKDPQESNIKPLHGRLVPSDTPRPEDTWQSWPTATDTAFKPPSTHQSQILWETDDKGNDVLFDAGSFDAGPVPSSTDDDFGDFEQVVTKRSGNHVSQVASQLATANLLDLDADEAVSKEVTGTTSLSNAVVPSGPFPQIALQEEITTSADEQDDEWGEFATTEVRGTVTDGSIQRDVPQKAIAPTTSKKSSPVRAKTREKSMAGPLHLKSKSTVNEPFEEEPWDNFDNDEPDKPYMSNHLANPPPQQDLLESAVTADAVQRDRPTNMPPPAVLLAWLPKVFSALATEARQPHADVGVGVGVSVGIPTLQAYRVSARIVAGRASRWKRDNILAQSMRIGAAGRSGGMKLTALDKGESRKEDQAADEVVASWNRFSHILNPAIIKAKAQKPPMALSSKLSARMATGLDVITATHSCAVCGLRRNERVVGIDVSVSDTFGEFWLEHWGHKDCADTWYKFNKLLDQR